MKKLKEQQNKFVAPEISERIKELIGHRRNAFAEQAGVSAEMVRRWCLGDYLPQTENLLKLHKVTGVSIDALLFGKTVKVEGEDENIRKEGESMQREIEAYQKLIDRLEKDLAKEETKNDKLESEIIEARNKIVSLEESIKRADDPDIVSGVAV